MGTQVLIVIQTIKES